MILSYQIHQETSEETMSEITLVPGQVYTNEEMAATIVSVDAEAVVVDWFIYSTGDEQRQAYPYPSIVTDYFQQYDFELYALVEN